ncbi:hypothetical protein [Enterobacter ludwigii]|jgi:hypothetical protein
MPIKSAGYIRSVNSIFSVARKIDKQRCTLLDTIVRVFNSNVSFDKVVKRIDAPLNEARLKKELLASKKTWDESTINCGGKLSSNYISSWVCESENYTTQLPSNSSPYRDEDTINLISDLSRMPKYKGTLYRVCDAPGFSDGKIKKGDTVITKRLLSFSSSLEFVKYFSGGRAIFFVLAASESAHNISGTRPEQAESVVDIDSAFKVEKIITTKKGSMVVHLEEIVGQVSYGKARDMYTGEQFLHMKN